MTDQTQTGPLERFGWRLTVDPAAEEVQIVHEDSGTTYAFDAEGNLRIPGDANVGGEISELRATLAAALDAAGNDITNVGSVENGGSSVSFDESSGDLSIESEGTVSIDAQSIELSASSGVDVTGAGQVSLESQGQLSIESAGNASIDADGPLSLEGAVISLN